MRFVIDSSGWLEYFQKGGKADRFAQFIEKASPGNCFTPSVILYEVYKKIKKEHGEEKASLYVGHIKGSTSVIAVDEKIALLAADLSLENGLPFADAIIKAAAKSLKARVVTSDSHFRGLEDVELIE